MMAKNTAGKRVTASRVLFFLVAASSSWAFLPGLGAVNLASASSSSAAANIAASANMTSESSSSANVTDFCTDEMFNCVVDSTCLACVLNESSEEDDDVCVGDYVDNSITWDFCVLLGATYCCDDMLTGTGCTSNDEMRETMTCTMETFGCSVDDLPCFNDTSASSSTMTSSSTPSPLPYNGTDDYLCQDESIACAMDDTCMNCIQSEGDDDTDDDCAASYLDETATDMCLVTGAAYCCTYDLSSTSCTSNTELMGMIACTMEDFDCSIDDLPCLGDSDDTSAAGSVALVKEGPLSTAKVVVAGTVGLLVTIAGLIL